MELDLGPEIAQFRAELRDWIAAEAPEALAGLFDWNMALTGGSQRAAERASAESHPAYAEWVAKLAARRLICAAAGRRSTAAGAWTRCAWPCSTRSSTGPGVPRVNRGMGESLVGPSVIVHGTPEQKAYFLPRIISGEDRYCQGFSEPNHGSDLAARGDPRRGRRRRGRHHRPEGLDLGSGPGQPDVRAVPDRPGRGTARGAVLRADRLHRARRGVPAGSSRCRGPQSSARTSSTARGRRCSTSSAGWATAGGWP